MIIGICGYKGSGKDTVGDYLHSHYNFKKDSFAKKLKESVAALFDISVEEVDRFKEYGMITLLNTKSTSHGEIRKKLTWREFLQRYGTEAHRNIFGKDFWVRAVNPFVAPRIVYTDCRFKNEADQIIGWHGILFFIERPGYESDGHASEDYSWLAFGYYPICRIINDGTIEDLHKKIDEVLSDLELD